MSVDLARIDAELDELGPFPEGLAELVARYGEPDLSLAHVDSVLDALGAGAEIPVAAALTAASAEDLDLGPVGTVAAGSGRVSIRDTVVDRPAPTAEREAADAAEFAEAFAESKPPVSEWPPVEVSAEAPAEPPPLDGFAMAELDEEGSSFSAAELARLDVQDVSEMFQRVSEPAEPPIDDAALELAPERGPEPTEPPVAPVGMSALLDQDLDPGDFPQTPSSPPPSVPPASTPPEASLAAEAADAAADDFEEDDDADFELMVDDEDIIEIEADDFEMLDDDDDDDEDEDEE